MSIKNIILLKQRSEGFILNRFAFRRTDVATLDDTDAAWYFQTDGKYPTFGTTEQVQSVRRYQNGTAAQKKQVDLILVDNTKFGVVTRVLRVTHQADVGFFNLMKQNPVTGDVYYDNNGQEVRLSSSGAVINGSKPLANGAAPSWPTSGVNHIGYTAGGLEVYQSSVGGGTASLGFALVNPITGTVVRRFRRNADVFTRAESFAVPASTQSAPSGEGFVIASARGKFTETIGGASLIDIKIYADATTAAPVHETRLSFASTLPSVFTSGDGVNMSLTPAADGGYYLTNSVNYDPSTSNGSGTSGRHGNLVKLSSTLAVEWNITIPSRIWGLRILPNGNLLVSNESQGLAEITPTGTIVYGMLALNLNWFFQPFLYYAYTLPDTGEHVFVGGYQSDSDFLSSFDHQGWAYKVPGDLSQTMKAIEYKSPNHQAPNARLLLTPLTPAVITATTPAADAAGNVIQIGLAIDAVAPTVQSLTSGASFTMNQGSEANTFRTVTVP